MVCSPEQMASNARNSLKSKGPASPEGRARVARNSLKHGLTGAGIVVPDEDVAVIQERFDGFNANLNPLGVVSEFLVRHLAMLSVRMDRCARHEAATLTKHMHLTVEAEAEQDQLEFQALIDRITRQPAGVCRELETTPRGIDWMIASWEDLKAALLDPNPDRWNANTAERAENLVGHRFVPPYATRICELSGAYHGHLEGFEGWPDLPPAERRKAAQEELARIMDAEIARLKDVLAKLDLEKFARIEDGAMARALFDASKEAILARKYAAAAERAFFKTLKTIQELNASAIANMTIKIKDVTPETAVDSEKSALNFPPTPIVEGPPRRRPPAPADQRKSKPRRGNRDPGRSKT